MNRLNIASGLAHSARPSPLLAAEAVRQALGRLGQDRAARVLLFLSADFAHDPRPALLAAAQLAQTLNVAGCTALGVMNEDDWLLDSPAACALVFGNDHPQAAEPQSAQLTLAAPNTLDQDWLRKGPPRFGGVAGDATGLGPYKVWRQSQLQQNGQCELPLGPVRVAVSRGMQPVGAIHRVSEVAGFDLQTLDGRLAAATLRRNLASLPPLHELALAQLDDDQQIRQLLPLVSVNPDSGVTVAARLQVGEQVQWMQRSARLACDEVSQFAQGPAPAAALLFSCAGRGAALHGGQDREWQLLREAWPKTALAGFYGNGQIARLHGENRLLHQSLVMAALG